MTRSDKNCAYLEDPDDMVLNCEFDGVNKLKDEVEDLKCKYVEVPSLHFLQVVLLIYDCVKLGTVRELCCLIPNFQKKFDEGSSEELTDF